MGKHYVQSISGCPFPPLPSRESAWLNAIEIGRAMYRVAQHQRHIVRYILSLFAVAVNSDRQVVLSVASASHAQVARGFIRFVSSLGIRGLEIGLVAYRNRKGDSADLDALRACLGLPDGTQMRTEQARNANADSPARQAGLEVVRTTSKGRTPDQAFLSAMILGAAVEMWRFGSPVAPTPAAVTSGQQTSTPSDPLDLDPRSKLQPAYETMGIAESHRESILNGDPE